MKSFLITVIFSCTFFIYLNAQPCTIPMATNMFKRHMSQMALQSNDSERLNYAKSMLQGSCLLSTQIKDFAIVFTGDYYRYQFCKKAWKHTFDKENFYDVYDAFLHLSNAIRLYDFVNKESSDEHQHHDSGHQENWFPNLIYPTALGYNGKTGCSQPIANNDFEILVKKTLRQNSDAAKSNEALKLVNSNCLSMEQLMKLSSIIELESNRLVFQMEAFPKVYDLEHYGVAATVFSHLPHQYQWNDFCYELLNESNSQPAVNCEVTEQDYIDLSRSIKNVSVNSTRVTMAKQIIETKKCFTVDQLRGIVKLFSVESSRYEIAEFGYDYCVDSGNYYQITEEFNTTSSKNKMLDFLNSKK